jgi:hypothetical protein
MAVAAPARRSSAPATVPPPSRTTPPRRKAAPSRPAAPRKNAAPARRAPARQAPRGRAATAPATAPLRRAPARAPQRGRPKPKRANGQLIPLAVGHAAVAVRQLPDSGLVVRMTRGRAWIAVLGLLLVGIVALNVVTLSFAASLGKIDQQITALEQENSVLGGRQATRFSNARIRAAAAAQGLAMPNLEEPTLITAGRQDVAKAAQRLAGAG